MQDALERVSRKLVNAENALRISDYYVCPECSAPVVLRAGHERAAYFAHASGVSDEECARYAAAFGNAAAQERAAAPTDYIDALQLQLRTKRIASEYGWALDLVVPTYKVDCGSIVIDVGGRITEINLDGNTSLYRTITVVPQDSPYKIVDVSPPQSRLSALKTTCTALNRNFATVFGHIGQSDVSNIPRANSLQPERTYAFIWSASHSQVFPDELVVAKLTSRDTWCGALVTIPHEISLECIAWLEALTQLKFIEASPAIIPLWPPLIQSQMAHRIKTLPQLPFSFFVEHSAGESTPPVFARSSHVERVAKAEPNNAPLYQLLPEGAQSVQLICLKGPRLDVDFQLEKSLFKTIRPGAVKLVALDKDSRTTEVGLHSAEFSTLLSRIRCGEFRFKEMILPTGARGQLKVRRNATWSAELDFESDHTSRISADSAMNASADLANNLVRILLDQALSVMIDFSSLGRAVVYGDSNLALEQRVDVSEEILRRIRQYFIQFPDASSISSKWRKLSDNQLFFEFQKSKPTKKSLSHYRFIRRSILTKK